MKNTFYLVLLITLMVSCKNKPTENQPDNKTYIKEEHETTSSTHLEHINKVLDAHGGLDHWNEMSTLEFSVEKPGGYEITTTDLKDRYALIEMPKHTIGFDGEVLWLKNSDNSEYDKDPKYYYNRMFYFYAMPFVLADDGIIYTETEPLVFEGKTYPGIHISYQNEVGESPEDEYIMYYDPDTNKMTWLAYTVTYGKNEKSKDFNFIKYSNWQEAEGLLVPETMVWYDVENNKPTQVKSETKFVSPMLTIVKMDPRVYARPENAEIIQ